MQALKSRLEDVFQLVSMQSFERLDPNLVITGGTPGNKAIGLDMYPVDESIQSRTWRMEFPFMTIQTSSTMCLLGLDPRLSSQMVVAERMELSLLTLPSFSDTLNVRYEDAVR